MPASSSAILLKASAISPKPSASSSAETGGTRTEKSPFIICWAALTIFLTGRSTIRRRRIPSMTVQRRLSNRTFAKVTLAADSIYASVNASPVTRVTVFRKRVIQQLMINRLRPNSQRAARLCFSSRLI